MCFANCHKGLVCLPSPANFFVVASCMTTTNSVFSTCKRMWVSRAVLSCQVFSCHPPSPPFSLSLLLQVTCRITRRFVLSVRMRRKIRSSPIRLLSIRENLINLIVIFAGVTSPNTTSRGNHGTTTPYDCPQTSHRTLHFKENFLLDSEALKLPFVCFLWDPAKPSPFPPGP